MSKQKKKAFLSKMDYKANPLRHYPSLNQLWKGSFRQIVDWTSFSLSLKKIGQIEEVNEEVNNFIRVLTF